MFRLRLAHAMTYRVIGKCLLYVIVHGLLVDADYYGRLAVGDSLLIKEK